MKLQCLNNCLIIWIWTKNVLSCRTYKSVGKNHTILTFLKQFKFITTMAKYVVTKIVGGEEQKFVKAFDGKQVEWTINPDEALRYEPLMAAEAKCQGVIDAMKAKAMDVEGIKLVIL